MTTPRVLYLIRYYPALTETFIRNEIDGLADLGVRASIAALGTRDDSRLAPPVQDVEVMRVPRRRWSLRSRSNTTGMQWLAGHQRPKDVARLPWLMKQTERFDRIHVHFAGEAAEWAYALRLDGGPPYTVTVHANDLFRPRASIATVLAGAEKVFTIANFHQDILAQMGIQSKVIRCGPVLKEWELPPPASGPLRALFVGRGVPKKGLHALLEAWEPRSAEQLHLVTDQPVPSHPSITQHGLLAPAQLRDVLAKSNIVILPCQQANDGDLDGIPLVLMEALAAQRPVITTAVSGIPELIDNTVGWLISDNSPPALRAAIQSARDPLERQRRGRNGPAQLINRGFTRSTQVQELVKAWR